MRGKSYKSNSRPHHADILRLMKQAQMSDDDPAVLNQKRLADTLDAVNAAGYLSDVQRRAPARLQIFGTKTLETANWSAVVLWVKRPGVHTYKLITLLGIWASLEGDEVRLIVGTRPLLYQAAMYAPDSYFHRIKTDFRPYYGKDTPPPSASTQLYITLYSPQNRLMIRNKIEDALDQWRAAQIGSVL